MSGLTYVGTLCQSHQYFYRNNQCLTISSHFAAHSYVGSKDSTVVACSMSSHTKNVFYKLVSYASGFHLTLRSLLLKNTKETDLDIECLGRHHG